MFKVEMSGRVSDMVSGSTCYLLEDRSRAGVEMLQGDVRGKTRRCLAFSTSPVLSDT